MLLWFTFLWSVIRLVGHILGKRLVWCFSDKSWIRMVPIIILVLHAILPLARFSRRAPPFCFILQISFQKQVVYICIVSSHLCRGWASIGVGHGYSSIMNESRADHAEWDVPWLVRWWFDMVSLFSGIHLQRSTPHSLVDITDFVWRDWHS